MRKSELMIKHESIAFRQAIESDRNALIRYLETEMIDNTYLLADIYYIGRWSYCGNAKIFTEP